MAKVLTDEGGTAHLRKSLIGDSLCGCEVSSRDVTDGDLNCPVCAQIALLAVELVTKAEKREWRKL